VCACPINRMTSSQDPSTARSETHEYRYLTRGKRTKGSALTRIVHAPKSRRRKGRNMREKGHIFAPRDFEYAYYPIRHSLSLIRGSPSTCSCEMKRLKQIQAERRQEQLLTNSSSRTVHGIAQSACLHESLYCGDFI
jgi:hypothetical protein